jgi:hypothetical protein
MELDGLTQKIKIDHPLGIRSENVLPSVAALLDMMRDAKRDYSLLQSRCSVYTAPAESQKNTAFKVRPDYSGETRNSTIQCKETLQRALCKYPRTGLLSRTLRMRRRLDFCTDPDCSCPKREL